VRFDLRISGRRALVTGRTSGNGVFARCALSPIIPE